MTHRSNQTARLADAFTLVELLVVVGIISLLVAILLPALSKARDQARIVACMSGARQVYFSVEMYCNDNRDAYPATSGGGGPSRPVPLPIWTQMLVDGNYLNAFLQTNRGGCPYGPDPYTNLPTVYWTYEAQDPSGANGEYYSHNGSQYRVSYGLNPYLQSGFCYRNPPPDGVNYYGYWNVGWRRSSGVIRKNAAQTGVIFCSHEPWTWQGQQLLYPLLFDLDLWIKQYPTVVPHYPIRHRGKGVPVACADGHVAFVSADEVFDMTWGSKTPFATGIMYQSFYGLLFNQP